MEGVGQGRLDHERSFLRAHAVLFYKLSNRDVIMFSRFRNIPVQVTASLLLAIAMKVASTVKTIEDCVWDDDDWGWTCEGKIF